MSSSRRPSKRSSRAKASAGRAPKGLKATRPATRATGPATGARRAAGTNHKTRRAHVALPPNAAPPNPSGPAPRQAIRLPGSTSSRLTIKPGAPKPPRAQLELSAKPRPSGLRLLSEVELDEDEVLIDSFDATLDGVTVRVTAVLERTCVYVDRGGDRRLARKNDLWVEADKLPVRRRSLG